MNRRIYRPLVIFIVIIAVIPLITSLIDRNYYLTQITMTAYYLLVALGLCMLMGYTGQVSMGQAGFFAIGGYTSAFLTTTLHLSPWVSFLIAVLLSVLTAYVIGIPVLKLKGHYLVMATMSFGVIIEVIVRGTMMFGGPDGIVSVPAFQLLPGLSVNGDAQDRVMNYYIAWTVVTLGLLVLINLINSRVGRALRSLHDNEEATNSMGVDTARYKLNVFILSAVFAAVGGVFLTHFNGSIGPGEASVMKSVRYVAIVAVGGMANIWGTLVMGLVLSFLSLRGVFGTYDDAVFGTILILVMIFAPDGLFRKNQLPIKGKEYEHIDCE